MSKEATSEIRACPCGVTCDGTEMSGPSATPNLIERFQSKRRSLRGLGGID